MCRIILRLQILFHHPMYLRILLHLYLLMRRRPLFQRDIFPSGGLQIRIQIKIFIFREVLRIVFRSVGSGFAEVCNDQSDSCSDHSENTEPFD